ncbi:MAG: helix-turn-helix domain-containing protein [Acidimicrobiales bacterium]
MSGSNLRETRRTGPHDDTVGKVLPAARRLLAVEGPAALTPSRLHQETGVSRATIYRHWASPDDLLADVLDTATGTEALSTATGTEALDTATGTAGQGGARVVDPLGDALVAVAAALRQPQTAALLISGLERARFSEPVAAAAQRFLDRMVAPVAAVAAGRGDDGRDGDRGGVAAGPADPTVRRRLADLVGPLLFEALIGEARPAEAIRALGAQPPGAGHSSSSAEASSAIRSVS